MNDEETYDELQPAFTFGWLEVFITTNMMWVMFGPFRVLFYDPRVRDNWQLDYILRRDCVQLGIGPLVFVCVV